MVRNPHDGSLGDSLGALIGRAALGAVAGALLLLVLGLVAEGLRRRHRARRVLALLDLTLPIGVRTAVVSLLALIATFTGPHPAGAGESVRGWLGQVSSSTTATTTRPPVATPGALSERAPKPATGPVVLIPPVTVERLDPPTTTTAPPAAAPPSTSLPVAPRVVPAPAAAPRVPSAPAATLPSYVVQRGDCLWSIAARLLGARADARAIDIGWRQIYAANRAAIGDDPNLIHIGLTLELPPLVAQP